MLLPEIVFSIELYDTSAVSCKSLFDVRDIYVIACQEIVFYDYYILRTFVIDVYSFFSGLLQSIETDAAFPLDISVVQQLTSI